MCKVWACSQNDDAATVTVNNVSELEANGPFVFDVALSQPVDEEVTVELIVDGTATVADNDYAAVTDQIVTFSAGTTLQSVTVDITDDARLEIEETFAVALADLDANGRNVTLGGPATGVIQDDEPLPELSIGDVVKAENDGVFTFTVTLLPVSILETSVEFTTTAATAQAPNDYTAISGTIRILAGETSATIAVSIVDEALVEGDESFTVDLANPVNATISDRQGQGTINNDDSTSVSIDDVSHSEGDAGSTLYTFTLSLSEGVAEDVTVVVDTADITATVVDGDDSGVSNQIVTFSAGDSLSETITINVSGDTKAKLTRASSSM